MGNHNHMPGWLPEAIGDEVEFSKLYLRNQRCNLCTAYLGDIPLKVE